MKSYEVIAEKADHVGISTAELSRRTGINAELLRRSLQGDRCLKADELVSLCYELSIEISDLRKAS